MQTNQETYNLHPTVLKNNLPSVESSPGDLPAYSENTLLARPTHDSDDGIIFISSQTKQQPVCSNSDTDSDDSVLLDLSEKNVTYYHSPHKDFHLNSSLSASKFLKIETKMLQHEQLSDSSSSSVQFCYKTPPRSECARTRPIVIRPRISPLNICVISKDEFRETVPSSSLTMISEAATSSPSSLKRKLPKRESHSSGIATKLSHHSKDKIHRPASRPKPTFNKTTETIIPDYKYHSQCNLWSCEFETELFRLTYPSKKIGLPLGSPQVKAIFKDSQIGQEILETFSQSAIQNKIKLLTHKGVYK